MMRKTIHKVLNQRNLQLNQQELQPKEPQLPPLQKAQNLLIGVMQSLTKIKNVLQTTII